MDGPASENVEAIDGAPLGDLDVVLLRDRPALARLAKRIRTARKQGRPHDRDLARYERRCAESLALVERRRAAAPAVTYPPELPVVEAREGLLEVIRDNQVVVVCGETGSGKSTQLPKLCLELGRGVQGVIGHTQPRRIAARSLCRRIAQELGGGAGVHAPVGYKVRHADTTGPETLVKLMTDGVLLAEIEHDRDLRAYDTLIIDEAHERSCNIDFLLGYLRGVLRRRGDLKVIVTSATIDPQRFAEHFAGEDGSPAPVVEVSGRSYPVEVRYRPPIEGEDPLEGVASALAEIDGEPRGDVLVFLPTERDIREVHKRLRGRQARGERVLPLYGRLSPADQDKVFQAGGSGRRVVLATNVAETSVTVPGIRYVVDTGTARVSRYSPRSGMQRLPIEAVSKASADQRAGRCGRVAAGVCVRLYDEEAYLGRDDFTLPEIRRSNLAAVILRMKALGLGECAGFPFLDAPKPAAVRAGEQALRELGAIDKAGALTALGKRMARLPVDPRPARILLEAEKARVLPPVLAIVAALEAGDPRVRPTGSEASADAAHEALVDAGSDFLTFWRMWGFVRSLREAKSRSAYERECKARFLSPARLREWSDVQRQLREAMGPVSAGPSFPPGRELTEDERDAVHRSLMAGYLSRVAQRNDRGEYVGSGRQKLRLWPGSTLREDKPLWIVAAELVETTRAYARTLAPIDPGWAEELGGELCRRTYGAPSWSARRGRVVASEKVSLFGLPVRERKAVPYSRVDRAEARRVFLREALVGGELGGEADFLRHNVALRDRVRSYEDRFRHAGLLKDAESAYSFYAERVPEEVCDRPGLMKWLEQQAGRDEGERLRMDWSHVAEVSQEAFEAGACPERLDLGGFDLALRYRFRPGEADDGVTLVVPVEAIGSIEADRLDWLVPSRLEEKLTELIRGLPKESRRAFSPAPDTARLAAGRMVFGDGPFYEAAADAIGAVRGVALSAEALRAVALPDTLKMNLRVVDERERVLQEGRDLGAVRAKLRDRLAEAVKAEGGAAWERSGLTAWGETPALPRRVMVESRGLRLPAYPALLDEGDSAGVRLFPSAWRADFEHARGVRRLACVELAPRLRSLVRHDREVLALARRWCALDAGGLGELEAKLQLVWRIAGHAMGPGLDAVRDRATLEVRLTGAWENLDAAQRDVLAGVGAGVEAWSRASEGLRQSLGRPGRDALHEVMRRRLGVLTEPGWVLDRPWAALCRTPVYFEALRVRLDRYQGRVEQDARGWASVEPYVSAYDRLLRASPVMADHPAVSAYRWAVEEWSVAVFWPERALADRPDGDGLRALWRAAVSAC